MKLDDVYKNLLVANNSKLALVVLDDKVVSALLELIYELLDLDRSFSIRQSLEHPGHLLLGENRFATFQGTY